jgi:predicted O-methyltransferase YrrM
VDEARWAQVDQYIEEQLVGEDPVLVAARQASAAAGLPSHDVSAAQGRLLEILARVQGAQRILELGTLGGYSTIWLARALAPGGELVSLEADAAYAEVARANIARAGLAGRVDVVTGPALETLPRLSGPFDLVFLDADKRSSPAHLGWAIALGRPGTLIVADNVVRGGAVADAATGDESVDGVRGMLELMGADRRLVATAIQTVGAKGYDGFALAVLT